MHFELWDGHPPVESFMVSYFISPLEFFGTIVYIITIPIVLFFSFYGDEDVAFFGGGQME